VPSGFIDEVFVSGLTGMTQMQFAPDGRLFVSEQRGTLRVVKNGALLTTPFVTVTVDQNGERGLMGIAFDPAFATNQFVYVYYTATSGGTHNRVSRFTASGDVAVAGSEVVIMDLDPLSSATNHNGGGLHFGTDGKLYVTVGENANGANAQTLGNRLGKMLRINKDGTIPTDNPFFGTATGANRSIWVLGLRNPFTFAVQPGTGKMYINDVGGGAFEEVDEVVKGANYGWPHSEGNQGLQAGDTAPLYAYPHGGACAITGGAFYNPSNVQFPSAWVGHYFFGDLCGGWIRRLDPATRTATDFATGLSSPTDVKIGADGALYYLNKGNGRVGRIRAATNQAPVVNVQPQSQTVAAGQPVTFTATPEAGPLIVTLPVVRHEPPWQPIYMPSPSVERVVLSPVW
jgi:glucose/arabinose dehydrogenase